MSDYLSTPITRARRTDTPRWGMAVDGYTLRSGAPTSVMVQLKGEKRWRRVMCWCFSNIGTIFIRVNGTPLVIQDHDLPTIEN